MKKIVFTVEEFDKLMDELEEVQFDDDEYIPSMDDVLDYIEKYTERYYLYLLWYSEHKPKPKTEEEKRILKRITKIINNVIDVQ